MPKQRRSRPTARVAHYAQYRAITQLKPCRPERLPRPSPSPGELHLLRLRLLTERQAASRVPIAPTKTWEHDQVTSARLRADAQRLSASKSRCHSIPHRAGSPHRRLPITCRATRTPDHRHGSNTADLVDLTCGFASAKWTRGPRPRLPTDQLREA